MKSAINFSAFLGSLLILVSSSVNAGDWPDFPAPKGANLKIVADKINYNGLPIRIARFTDERSPEELIEFYAEKWNNDVVIKKQGYTTIVAKKLGEYFATIQLLSTGDGTVGTIGISKTKAMEGTARENLAAAREKVANRGQGFPLMDETYVLNDIKSQDGNKSGRTLILSNQFSVAQNVTFYRQHMRSDGWRLVSNPQGVASSIDMLRFRKNNTSAVLTFDKRQGKTYVSAQIMYEN